MRLAATTYSFRELELSGALDAIAAAGFRDVEVWLPHADEGYAAARSALGTRGLRAVAVSAGGVYRPDDDAVVRGARLALELEASIVVACVAPGLLRPTARALDTRLTLCLENHWDQAIAHPSEVSRALAAEPRAAACLDTGHALSAGEDPCRFVRLLGHRLAHVHLKDGRAASLVERLAGRRIRRRVTPRPIPSLPGSGDLDVVAFVRTLAETGYPGAISVEYEGARPEVAVAALAASARAAG